MNRRTLLVPLLLIATLGPAQAAELKLGDDTHWLKLGLLLQGQTAWAEHAAPDGDSGDFDAYLRRMRLMLSGQLGERVSFFVMTDLPNYGKQGDFSGSMFVQDAWVEFNVHSALQIDAGMLLAPFSRHGLQSAAALQGVDYHAALFQYPGGAHRVWRDFGVQARGRVLSDRFEYRLAALNGVHGKASLAAQEDASGSAGRQQTEPRNPRDWPRCVGRVSYNFFETEGGPGPGGFYPKNVHLAVTDEGIVTPKPYLAVGASFDWQKDLNVLWASAPGGTPPGTAEADLPQREIAELSSYWAAALDLFFELPLGERGHRAVTGQLGAYHYDHGTFEANSYYQPASAAAFSGAGGFAELGFRSGAWEPVIGADWFDATADDRRGDTRAWSLGLNWWWQALGSNLKLQVLRAQRDAGPWRWGAQLQAQLLL